MVRGGRCDGVDVEKMGVGGFGLEVKVNGTRRRSVYRQLGASAHMCACEPRIADKRETGWERLQVGAVANVRLAHTEVGVQLVPARLRDAGRTRSREASASRTLAYGVARSPTMAGTGWPWLAVSGKRSSPERWRWHPSRSAGSIGLRIGQSAACRWSFERAGALQVRSRRTPDGSGMEVKLRSCSATPEATGSSLVD